MALIEKHMEDCGSRTTRCDICRCFVRLHDWERHQGIDCLAELQKRKEEEEVKKQREKDKLLAVAAVASLAQAEEDLISLAKAKSLKEEVRSEKRSYHENHRNGCTSRTKSADDALETSEKMNDDHLFADHMVSTLLAKAKAGVDMKVK